MQTFVLTLIAMLVGDVMMRRVDGAEVAHVSQRKCLGIADAADQQASRRKLCLSCYACC